MPEVILKPEQLKKLESRSPDLRETLARRQANPTPEEALQEIASAYKAGMQAGGKDEAERQMQEKLDEINPPDQQNP